MKRKNPFFWMPLSIEQCEINRLVMPPNIFGAWVLLLIHQWKTGKPLPNDSRKLSVITGLDERTFKKHRKVLLANMRQKCGKIVEKMLMDELQRCRVISEKKRAAANSRWKKGDAHALHMHKKTDAHALPTSSTCLVSVVDLPPDAKSQKSGGSK